MLTAGSPGTTSKGPPRHRATACARSTRPGDAGLARSHLDTLGEVAARFASEAEGATLTAFLAYLEAAEAEERGLPAGEVEVWIEKCEELLNGFEQEVYRRSSDDSVAAVDAGVAPVGLVRVLRPVAPQDDAEAERETEKEIGS